MFQKILDIFKKILYRDVVKNNLSSPFSVHPVTVFIVVDSAHPKISIDNMFYGFKEAEKYRHLSEEMFARMHFTVEAIVQQKEGNHDAKTL